MGIENVISIKGLKNQFGTHVVHENLNLDVKRGEILGVIGGSGTGKSVLLRTIIGLNQKAEGEIQVLGKNLDKVEPQERSEVERKWGVLFQDGALFSSLTVSQNVQVPLKENLKLSKKLMREIAALKIRLAGLPAEAGDKFPSELSGGMRKRAGLARALSLDPEIVFLDEPTAGLDPIGAANFDQLIKELQETLGLTVFMVTHDLDSLHAICDRIAVLAEKRIYAIGDIPSLLKETQPWIHEYFHGPRARGVFETGA